jgi:putative oxidoreductase
VWAALAVLVEFGGGLAIFLGIRVRLAALFMIAFMIMTMLLSHNFWTMEGAERAENFIHFMKNLAIIGGFLFLFLLGGGPIALDRPRTK